MDEPDEPHVEVVAMPIPDLPVPTPAAGFLTDRRIEIEVDGDSGEPRLRIIEGQKPI